MSTPERNHRYNAKTRAESDAYKRGRGCDSCGYDLCAAALDFHHTVPGTKGSINARTLVRPSRAAELALCSLLCANCHRELHDRERRDAA